MCTPLIRKWREQHGVSLGELAGLTGFSPSTLSRVENGHRNLSALSRLRLARALGVRVEVLFPVSRQEEPGEAA